VEVAIPDTINRTLNVTHVNLARQQSWYFGSSYSFHVLKWWETYNNLSIYYAKFSTQDLNSMAFKSAMAAYNFNTSQTFTINSSTSIDLYFSYLSKHVFSTYLINPIYSLDFGVKKVFAEKRANLKFTVEDIFNTHHENINTLIPGQYYHIYQKWETRIARLTFFYRFGGNQIKAEPQTSKSTADEDNRVKH
jgi:hypothetical protein